MAMGTEGVGFWFRGPNNFVKNNVAANFQNPTVEAAYGYAFLFRYLGNIAVPKFKGAMNAADFTTVSGHAIPIRQFEDNEAYGAMQGGFTQWWVGGQDPNPTAGVAESVIKNLVVWHVYNKAVYMYPSHRVVFDGLVIRGKFDSTSRCCGDGVFFADYSSTGIVIRNSDIQGMEEGIKSPSSGFSGGSFAPVNLTIENTLLRNNLNLLVYPNGSVNGCWMDDKLVVASNVRFEAPPGRSLSAISMSSDSPDSPDCPAKRSEMRVYAYNGVATDNFQAYTTSSSVIPRPSCGSPATRAGINGLTCPIAAQGPVPPTATLTASPTSITSGQSATLSWNTTNASSVVDQSGDRNGRRVGHQERDPDGDHDLHADRDQRHWNGDRADDRHRHRRRHQNDADDYLEHSGRHHLRDGVERDAAQCEHDGRRFVRVLSALRNSAVGRRRTDAVGHVHADRHRQLQLGHGDGRDHRQQGDAAHHVGEPGRHHLRDAARRHAVERDDANVAGTFTYTPPSGTVLGVGAQQALSTSFAPASTANYNTPPVKTVQITVNATPTTQNNAARANAYDDAWQGGATGWVENAKAILAGGSGVAGARAVDRRFADARSGARRVGPGRRRQDRPKIRRSPTGCMRGCRRRASTASTASRWRRRTSARRAATPSATAWAPGTSWAAAACPPTAIPRRQGQKLQDCATYPNALNLTTMLAALPKAQFAIPEVNLEASNPGVFTDLQRMVDLMIANHIVPIIITYTYRTDAAFNNLVDQYNAGLIQYAQSKKLPLIDLNKEMLARLPFSQWPGRFLSDGTHYTHGTTQFPATSDPYANGGDPATHTTG